MLDGDCDCRFVVRHEMRSKKIPAGANVAQAILVILNRLAVDRDLSPGRHEAANTDVPRAGGNHRPFRRRRLDHKQRLGLESFDFASDSLPRIEHDAGITRVVVE